MKGLSSRIFMFLFVFAFMLVIFQYADNKRYSKAKESEITGLDHYIDSLETQLKSNKKKIAFYDNWYGFSLKTNSKARAYFENRDESVDSVISLIKNEIFAKNKIDQDNPLVPYAGMAGAMRINQVKVLNNRWVIAQFSDGIYWGDALLSYYFDKDHQLQFDTLDGVLYSQ